jgi:hypothetical protein
VEERVSEISILLSKRPDTGGFKARNLQMLYVTWWTTDPLEAIGDPREPIVEHGLKAGVVTGEGPRTPTVGRHE